jgi:hypothetical protein
VLAGSITRSTRGKCGGRCPRLRRGLRSVSAPFSPQRRLGLFLRGLEHALGQLGILQGEVELVGRQLLGALAERLALRRAQDILQPALCLLRLGQRRLDLGQAGLQTGVFAGESVDVHAPKGITEPPF